MVYEVKCDNCGDLLDFGGHDPEELPSGHSKIPDDAIKFDGNVYCQECVENFVRLGVGDVEERMDVLENQLENIRKQLGMEKGLNQ
ncbi:hypothetical protein [Candidatus Nanohalobium constans]|uniref:Uncharacterized protein n=1 Tax=Candidatus Nanohalobium constans TaxID=2565781 RepID=A0A5Q0UFY8_9ARCH|nr:hypothetical protein [Candidatus Nanohalobium constans]QGA80464.1 hypothetical protein LC1Nh_0567 [Candidatus Nanohalobium constans]